MNEHYLTALTHFQFSITMDPVLGCPGEVGVVLKPLTFLGRSSYTLPHERSSHHFLNGCFIVRHHENIMLNFLDASGFV